MSQNAPKSSGYTARFVAAEKGPVRLSSGLEIVASHDFLDKPADETLLIPGGPGVGSLVKDAKFIEHIRLRAQQAKRVVSVCKGAYFLAEAGILDGKSAGVATGIDLALAIVEEDFGVSVAMKVARLLVLYYRRPGSQAQFSAPLKAQEAAGKGFSNLHEWLLQRLESTISPFRMTGRQ